MRRRAILLVTTMVAALVVACGVALAANITCPNRPTGECVGTNNADTMTGTTQADNMRGRGGEDTMYGRGGADDLDGGEGIDEIYAGQGDDELDGGPNPNAVTSEKLAGGGGDDSYFFEEGWGDDKITDDETSGKDAFVFSSSVRRLNVNLDSSDGRGEVYSDGGTLFFPAAVEIEDVEGGNNRDVVRGNDASNSFVAKDGDDSLYGRAGDDVLTGGFGADAFNGGPGDDKLEGGGVGDVIAGDLYIFEDGWGKDSITDAAGTDHLFFGELTSSVTVNLATGTATDGGTNTVTWTPKGIENVIEDATGGTVNDSLIGNDLDNTLSGQRGNDTISGGSGNDVIYGRGGSEKTATGDPGISGGPGKDTVYGDNPPKFSAETGDDVIDVRDGTTLDEIVDCGDGHDTVYVDVIPGPDGTELSDFYNEDTCEDVNPPAE
jgi:Ca2+-binding RTX toxin-like protein